MSERIGPIALPPPGGRASGTFTFDGDEGLERYAVRVEQAVAPGETVGEMVDLLGEPLGRIGAPVGGVVLFIVTSPAIKKDGLLLAIGAL